MLERRYASHPLAVKNYNTEELREHFLIQDLFVMNTAKLTYTHEDRLIVGGITTNSEVKLEVSKKDMGADFFFERREGGIINVGKGTGVVSIDGKEYELNCRDGLYIGLGAKEVIFKAKDAANPPKFYLNSSPAHKSYPTTLITLEKANKVHLGDQSTSNKRTINQYIVPGIVESCQLVMGMTILEPNNMWNTMPCHTHDRRMEAYFYFDMEEETRVFHFMGEPTQTRHLVIANEEAIISPSWSIHSGVGTSRYTFIWGMCGENMTFDDMDFVAMKDLR
ncbi:MAG: 5-dehydro-4-deoxy-D-glucuronate isomerase [Defluviitaleaceae bacterium]|nr:5-dehydro-4-deoxy-D-glucuronate isomerase [Defluviitaleaceae bacterium]